MMDIGPVLTSLGALLIGAAVRGVFCFGHIPDGWTIIGAAIIVAAGANVWSRDAALTRKGR